MKKKWFLVVSLALMATILSLVSCRGGAMVLEDIEGLTISNQQEGIHVSGQGNVCAVPDIVNLILGIEAQAESVAEAQEQAAEAMDNVMTALTSNGVDKNDIQTQYYSIHQVTKWDRDKEEEVIIGYGVTNTVTTKIRDTDKASSIIDAVVKAGGDLTRINNISFSIDDPTAYYEEARAEAMADVKAKAEQLARLAGVNLGKPTYISEETIYIPSSVYRGIDYALEDAEGLTIEMPINPGEIEISLNVQVTYDIR